MKNITLAVLILVFAFEADTQTLNTADTSGKGKAGIFVSSNALFLRDFTVANYSFAYGTYGINNRVDLYGGVSTTTLLGQTQVSAGGGANMNIVKTKLFSVSDYVIASTPITHRADGCGLVVFNSVIVSKSLGKVTPYSGFSATIPLGDIQNKLFTGASTTYNVPVGIMIPKGKFAYFAEYNFGRAVKTVSVGVAFTP
jgi:hypothetical protein